MRTSSEDTTDSLTNYFTNYINKIKKAIEMEVLKIRDVEGTADVKSNLA
ncbi:hypothetical protein Cs308_0071 [Candidatus Chlamydia sanziniae]|uniref:Uncharacterized protein n=1 Tax=Candidatus Chlamydia sanziniae TaxID=1806891 RepID=A0A1A9HU62_9CHLA|nr:hypothetical protein Cs308_0071 [Candidatus Chlamydia sanziniae]